MIAQWTLQDYWINFLLACNVDRSKAQEMHSCTGHYNLDQQQLKHCLYGHHPWDDISYISQDVKPIAPV